LNALVIGFGSIGKRHYEVLSRISLIKKIAIVTAQTLPEFTTYKTIDQVDDLENYDYFVIASETFKHFDQIDYLEKNTKNKIIFCEKPLFESDRELKIVNNNVFVGYVLRFHPLLQKLKNLLENEKILSAMINCGQYLPTWRSGIDYRISYSAHKSQGGGVLLDLSHEIDYAQWLFGNMVDIKSYQVKISDLEIDSDDLVTMISKTEKGVIVTLSIDYINKVTYRKMMLHTIENTYELDFINNVLLQKNKNGSELKYQLEDLERNSMFEKMHRSILSDHHSICTYQEGQNVMKTISIIQEQNK
jgi:CMP-N,N'-diacetyllegionaminic acid synthase